MRVAFEYRVVMAEGGNPVPVQDWTAQDVKNHFEKIRMCGKFASQCESQNIEGSNLSELSQEDLINVLNLTLGEAKAVLKAINVLMPKSMQSSSSSKKPRLDEDFLVQLDGTVVLPKGNHQLEALTSQPEDVIDMINISVHMSVYIYGDKNLRHLLLKMSTLTWREVYLFLCSATKPGLTDAAALFTAVITVDRGVSFKQFNVSTPGDTLPKGIYVLCQQSAEFELRVPNPVIAFSQTSSRSTSTRNSLTASPTTSKSIDLNTSINTAAMVLQLNSSDRVSSFHTDVMQRDGSCVISGAGKYCEAAHIVPLNYKADYFLPETIMSILLSFVEGKNDVKNGILLRRDLHSAFEQGYIALKPLLTPQELFHVVLVFEKDTYLKEYHLMPLRSKWVNLESPHPTLLNFHLNNCLAKYICGGGLANDGYFSDDDDEEEVKEASIDFEEGSSIEHEETWSALYVV